MVMCSALGSKEVIHLSFKLGACDYLVKPFTPDQVRSAISRAVEAL
jgi:response regulator of citrate/malate metabolism